MRLVFVTAGILVVSLSTSRMLRRLYVEHESPAPLAWVDDRIAPFRSVNAYGLFARMTMSRPEIVIEGSNDGETWLAYEYRWKPGDPGRRPRAAAPHMPRMDWQLWFAPMRVWNQNPWFGHLVERVLQGSPETLELFAFNPFPDEPPEYVRASLYNYEFTDFEERARTGMWWTREHAGDYCPPQTIR